jgi:predicted membrane protein
MDKDTKNMLVSMIIYLLGAILLIALRFYAGLVLVIAGALMTFYRYWSNSRN